MAASPTKPVKVDETIRDQDPQDSHAVQIAGDAVSQQAKSIRTISKTPEPPANQADDADRVSSTPSSPNAPSPYDWDDFERRYEEALREADHNEREVLKEAENLSKYFRAWASAASVQDDERAAKRLQTRRRFVNISEEKMEQKQQHYEEVVRAFESALALLRAT